MEKIGSEDIHLWFAYPGEITDQRLLAEYRSLLSDEELLKQARFRFARDRHRYLVTRAMVRTVLSKYVGVEPREWRFEVNEYGKPSIAAELTAARGIEFNVSYTDGLVVLGVSYERAIGVDVEHVQAREVDSAVADRYFAPAEVAALRVLPREHQHRRFFEYWTLKESYIKARGMGLSIPLDRFAFGAGDTPEISLTIDSALGDSAARWTFWRLPLALEYIAAVCAERGARERPSLLPGRCWP